MIYFITRNDDEKGLIKIGHASNVRGRLSSLATAVPEGLEILAVCSGGYGEEQAVHEYLYGDRYFETEWFWPTEKVMAVVAAAKDGQLYHIPQIVAVVSAQPVMPHYLDLTNETPVVHVAVSILNELVSREFKGQADTTTAARDRVADRIGQPRTLCATLWSRWKERTDLSGNLLQVLLTEMADAAERDGSLTSFLRIWTSKQQAEINARLFPEEGNP